MSTYYEAFLGIGKRFASEEEVKNFLKKHAFDDEQIEGVVDGVRYEGVSVERLDWVDWFVGFEVGDANEAEEFSGNVMYAHKAWQDKFPDEECRVVHDVKAW